MSKKTDRFVHAGKSRFEKEAYRKFIDSDFDLEKTEEDEIDTEKTDASANLEKEVKPIKITKKSFFLKMKDGINSNMGVTIIGGLAVIAIGGIFSAYIQISNSQVRFDEKFNSLEKEVTSMREDIDTANEAKNLFEVFKAEITKDIEYIKKKLKI